MNTIRSPTLQYQQSQAELLQNTITITQFKEA